MKAFQVILLHLIFFNILFAQSFRDSTLLIREKYNVKPISNDTLPFISNPERVLFENNYKWGLNVGYGQQAYQIYGLDEVQHEFNKQYNKSIKLQPGTVHYGFLFGFFIQYNKYIWSLAIKPYTNEGGYLTISELSMRYNWQKYFYTGASVSISRLHESYKIGVTLENPYTTLKSLDIDSGFLSGSIYAGLHYFIFSFESGYNLSQHKKTHINLPYQTPITVFDNKLVEANLSGFFFNLKLNLTMGAF